MLTLSVTINNGSMKYFLHLTVIIFALCVHSAVAQSVIFNPTDPVTYITADNQAPAQPAYGKAGKWIAKKRMGWNATNFKPYIYKGVAFRVRYPKTYNPTATDGNTLYFCFSTVLVKQVPFMITSTNFIMAVRPSTTA